MSDDTPNADRMGQLGPLVWHPDPPQPMTAEQEIRARALGLAIPIASATNLMWSTAKMMELADDLAAYIRDGSKPGGEGK